MDTIEKVYCTGHDNNDALVAALASKNNCDPMAMAAAARHNRTLSRWATRINLGRRISLTRCRQVSARQTQVWRELQVTLVSR